MFETPTVTAIFLIQILRRKIAKSRIASTMHLKLVYCSAFSQKP